MHKICFGERGRTHKYIYEHFFVDIHFFFSELIKYKFGIRIMKNDSSNIRPNSTIGSGLIPSLCRGLCDAYMHNIN